MTIYLAADHAGFALKEKVKLFLESGGYTVADMGAYEENKDDDYPDFMSAAAQAMISNLPALPSRRRAVIHPVATK